jgi:hypothetical protein
MYLILQATLGPGVYSASNRNEYRKHEETIMFPGSKVRPVRGADNLTALMCRLSRQCGIPNISQPYRPLQPVKGIALLYFLYSNYHISEH